MSSGALDAALKTLGSHHMTKKKSGLDAGYGSSTREMESESSVPKMNPDLAAIVDVEIGSPEPAKKVDRKRRNLGKKHVSKGSTSGCGKAIMEDLDSDDEEDRHPRSVERSPLGFWLWFSYQCTGCVSMYRVCVWWLLYMVA